jgi:hypothetical protein
MVKAFTLDYMHQSCLGVMKRLLLIWVKGAVRQVNKLSANQIAHVSARLMKIKVFIPSKYFTRKPRGLDEVDRWKATEFRQFLLYYGKIALKGILHPDLYQHFMKFSVAISMLICSRLAADQNTCGDARDLLFEFISEGHALYGQGFMVYNVMEYGSLDQCSAFPFENYLHKLKKLARSGKNPLVQLVKRLGVKIPDDTTCRTKQDILQKTKQCLHIN